jgi:proprotein convertase subtilisin/kexin type 5
MTCVPNSFRGSSPECACLPGYYEDTSLLVSICKKCPLKCETCESFSYCIKCAWPDSRLPPPYCLCPLGKYEKEDDSQCYNCSRKCQSCLNGETCLTCKMVEGVSFMSFCNCKDRFFDN